MNKINIILSIAIWLIICSCDPTDAKLLIFNNTDDTIYYTDSPVKQIRFYPIVKNNGQVDYLYSNFLPPNEGKNQIVPGKWEDQLINCEDSSITIFFFSKELINSATEDSIMKYQLYTKKKVFKVKDLEKLNWTVTYP